MRVIVCIKQVPAPDQLRIDAEARRLVREGVPVEINPYDRRALTEAIEIRNRFGGELIALTMGPPQARQALVEALAMGCDRGVHLLGKEFAGSDTLATARALAFACRRIGFDLILCGKSSTDAETSQVPPMLAELLDLPQVIGITRLEIAEDGRRFTAVRQLDDGFETVSAGLPAVLSAAERLIRPIKVSASEVAAAADRPIETWGPAAIGAPLDSIGVSGSPTWVDSIQIVTSNRRHIVRDGRVDPAAAVHATMADLLALDPRGVEEPTLVRPGPRPARDPDPAKAIWVVTDAIDGSIRPVTFELLGRAGELADALGGQVVAIALGGAVEAMTNALSAAGADRVCLAQSPALASYATEPYTAVLAQAIRQAPPYAVLLGSTDNGRDLAPRLAAQLGLGLTGDCIGLEIDDQGRLLQLKPAFGGSVVAPILSHTTPAMATVRVGTLRPSIPDPGHRAVVERWVVEPAPVSRVITLSIDRDTPEAIALDQASLVVGVGMGIGSPDPIPGIESLAGSIGGVIAGSRRVVDAGWLPPQLQVGLTGRRIAPRLYLTLGISGNFHHLVGVLRAGIILAVNSDPSATIFQQCDFGIVGDWGVIFPRLVDALRTTTPAWLSPLPV